MISSLQMVMYVSIEQFKIGMHYICIEPSNFEYKELHFFKNRNTKQF